MLKGLGPSKHYGTLRGEEIPQSSECRPQKAVQGDERGGRVGGDRGGGLYSKYQIPKD